jgi:uncharacterized delta-60 repeat protein
VDGLTDRHPNPRWSLGYLASSAFALALLAALLAPALARAAPGDLDRSFGGDGKVRTMFGDGYSYANAVVIDSHGRLVAAGAVGNSFALARYRRNGSLDDSFSGNGRVVTGFGSGFAQAQAVAIDSHGRIVAAGFSCSQSGCGDARLALARYRPNGNLDGSFGSDGKLAAPDFFGRGMAIDSRDRIVVTGASVGDFVLGRYKRNGTPDGSFGTGGRVTTDFGGAEGAISVAIGSRGRIFVAGGVTGISSPPEARDFALARYRPSGDLYASFGVGGLATTNFGFGTYSQVNSLAIDSHGRIVAAGVAAHAFGLARYDANGVLDDSFSGNGKLRTKFGRRHDRANSVAIDSRGRIVAGGGDADFKLARYRPSGRLDRSFSDDGQVTTRLAWATANSVAIDSKDRIVAAGVNSGQFELVRYIGYPRRR